MRSSVLALLLLAACGGAAASPPPAAVPIVPPAPPPPPPPPIVATTPQPAVTPSPPPVATPVTPAPAPPRVKPASPAPTLSGKDPAADAILANQKSDVLKTVLAAPDTYRFQVLYSIVKDGKLERHGWRADAEYFFPASSMKIPITVAAYERMNAARKAGKSAFTKDATLKIYPSKGNGEPYSTTLARETWRALIVSDNFSANRLLAITGHREIHETCFGLGLTSTRVRTGFATGEEIDPAEVSPRIQIVDAQGTVTELAARKSTLTLPVNDAKSMDLGTAYINDSGGRVNTPMPFKDKNAMKLQHLQDAMIHIMRPDLLPAPPKGSIFAASDTPGEDIAYLREALGTLPSESGLAGYDRNTLADYPLSPFLRGIERVRPRGQFQIFQKVGQAYGFVIHNAYIVDKATNKSFFLTAAIYGNQDGVMNDDKYDYDTIAFPALADVGEAFTRDALQ
jgi:hypothetical protein